MSTFLGCEPEALRDFAAMIHARRGDLDAAGLALRRAAESADIWAGPDAESFRAEGPSRRCPCSIRRGACSPDWGTR